MRTALLIGFIHGDDAPRILGTGNPVECNAAFKKFVTAPGPFRELQLWESGAGVTKRKRFEATKEAVAAAKAGFRKAAVLREENTALREKLEALESENAKHREVAEKMEQAAAKAPMPPITPPPAPEPPKAEAAPGAKNKPS